VIRWGLREWVREIQKSERIDRQFGLYIPGDSALAVTFGAMEEAVAMDALRFEAGREQARALEAEQDR
jgi:hypothetical protein